MDVTGSTSFFRVVWVTRFYGAQMIISDVYEAQPDSDPTPSGTILAVAIAIAITVVIAANADQLDSNCLAVVICRIWSHEQSQRNCVALNVCYCPSNSHHHCHQANDVLPGIGNRRGTDTQRP